MLEQMWEYCIFEFMKFNIDSNLQQKDQLAAVYRLKLCGPDGKITKKVLHQITSEDLSANRNRETKEPFACIIGRLGWAGWEMISSIELQDRMDICTVFTTYFKRPVKEGRPVTEPIVEYKE